MLAADPPDPQKPTGEQRDELSADSWSSRIYSVINVATAFMGLAAKEWFSFLLYQPTNPPFHYSSKFKEEFPRAVRLVVIVIVLTAIVAGSAGLISNKKAALSIVEWAMWVLIGAFLMAIVYHIFALALGVRRCLETARHQRAREKRKRPLVRKLTLIMQLQKRRKLTLGQILFSLLYIFVPWIPIYAFLWRAVTTAGDLLLLIFVILFWLCVVYMILNFVKAIKRITSCPWYRVWTSVLLPIFIVFSYMLFR